MTTPRLGHGMSTVVKCAWCARTRAFGLSGSGCWTVEPCVCGSEELAGWPCASPMGLLSSRARADVWAHLAHRAPQCITPE